MQAIQPEELTRAAQWLQTLRAEVGQAVVGQLEAVDQTLIALVASGHVLIEGVPGLGKTLLARALAQAMTLRYARVQFTPDLMPSDITGHAVLDLAARASSLGTLRVHQGPVFTNLLLADEINRAPAKTQSALLEVMQEYQVTLEGTATAAAAPVHGDGHAEPDRHRRHLPASGGTARPLPAEDRHRLSEPQRRERHRAADHAPACRQPVSARRPCAPASTSARCSNCSGWRAWCRPTNA